MFRVWCIGIFDLPLDRLIILLDSLGDFPLSALLRVGAALGTVALVIGDVDLHYSMVVFVKVDFNFNVLLILEHKSY